MHIPVRRHYPGFQLLVDSVSLLGWPQHESFEANPSGHRVYCLENEELAFSFPVTLVAALTNLTDDFLFSSLLFQSFV